MKSDTHHLSFPDRCRIVLTYDVARGISARMFSDILKNGDVASVILYNSEKMKPDLFFQNATRELVSVIQQEKVPVVIRGNDQIAKQLEADGIHREQEENKQGCTAIERYRPDMITGYGNLQNRHDAVLAGELQPDYIFFGKLGCDKKTEAYPRNLDLGEWWVAMIVIPCIVQAGSDLGSIPAVIATGVEFVALEEAIFSSRNMPQALYQANSLLDSYTAKPGR